MIRNDLVRMSTSDVGKGIPITDSLVISEKINYPHYAITRLIKKHIEDFEEFGAIDFESHLLNSKNVEIAILNENQFYLLITFLRNTKKAPLVKELKKELVRMFVFLKNEHKARVETRHIGIQARKSLTKAIDNNVDEGNFKRWSYSLYSKLVYKKVLGKTVKKLKEERGLTEKDNLRNHCTVEELEKIQELESKIANFIEFTNTEGKNDKEIYELVKKYIEKGDA